MKKNLLTISSFLLLLSTFLNAQVQNPMSLQGLWTGDWYNTTYSSTGSISLTITVDEAAGTMSSAWVVGGTVLGQPSIQPFNAEVPFNDTEINGDYSSSVWGDITGTANFATGEISGNSSVATINPTATNMVGTGTFNSETVTGTFTMLYGGQDVEGTMELTKQNPVNIPTDLSSNALSDGTIELTWVNNADNQTGFKLDRMDPASGAFAEIAELGPGITTYTDTQLEEGTEYTYRLAAYNTETESDYSNTTSATTIIVSVSENDNVPSGFKLYQNFPNPFNPTTVIEFSLPRQMNASLKIYSLNGKEVAELTNGNLTSGVHRINFNAEKLSSGVYFYSLRAGNYLQTKKLIVLK
jgi:hypothetical protein